eukprot:9175098-Prorocentrum_lima.AAC.1
MLILLPIVFATKGRGGHAANMDGNVAERAEGLGRRIRAQAGRQIFAHTPASERILQRNGWGCLRIGQADY